MAVTTRPTSLLNISRLSVAKYVNISQDRIFSFTNLNGTSPVHNFSSNVSENIKTINPLDASLAGTLVGIIILLIVFGNMLVVVAVIKDRHLKHCVQNRFIVSLAVADMLLGALIMPLSLQLEILKYWALNGALCDIWLATDVFLCTASTLSLVVVSLDRYWCVTKALEYPQLRTARRVNISIAGIWVTSAVVSLPPLAGWKSQSPSADDFSPQCNLSDELGYIIYSLTISFYIPLIIILIAYGRIFLVAKRRAAQHVNIGTVHSPQMEQRSQSIQGEIINAELQPLRTSQESMPSLTNSLPGSNLTSHPNDTKSDRLTINNNTNGNTISINYKNNTDKLRIKERIRAISLSHIIRKPTAKDRKDSKLSDTLVENGNAHRKLRQARGRERRATLTIAIIVMAFVICWLPFSVLYLIDRLCSCGIRDSIVFPVIFWLGYCNSAVNPVLYSIFNRDFRQAFHRLLCKKPFR